MTDEESYRYLAGVQVDLAALMQRMPRDSELFARALQAYDVIGTLMACFAPDREADE